MLKGLILICSLTGPCDRHTATDIIIVPGARSAVPSQCLQQAEAYLAAAPGIVVGGSVIRILCERRQRMEVRK